MCASRRIVHRASFVSEAYRLGRAHTLLQAAEALTAAGVIGSFLGRRRTAVARLAGLSLLACGACERFGIFEAGRISARDPKYVVVPQRTRLAEERHPPTGEDISR